MSRIYAKINSQGNGTKYRIFLETDYKVYESKTNIIEEAVPYDPATSIGEHEWFYISSFSKTDYVIDVIKSEHSSIDYSMLSRNEYDSLDYLFDIEQGIIYFQRIGKAKLIKKKGLLRIGNDFKYCDDYAAIPINEYPDAIYDKVEDKLYFRELSRITKIFAGISELYREATDQETEDFLAQDFIVLGTDFDYEKVKTPNRKRIALAMETLSKLNKKEKTHILKYISEYCPDIKKDEKTFEINSDEELKYLLYGIEERFYTTKIGKEKRLANSIIKM